MVSSTDASLTSQSGNGTNEMLASLSHHHQSRDQSVSQWTNCCNSHLHWQLCNRWVREVREEEVRGPSFIRFWLMAAFVEVVVVVVKSQGKRQSGRLFQTPLSLGHLHDCDWNICSLVASQQQSRASSHSVPPFLHKVTLSLFSVSSQCLIILIVAADRQRVEMYINGIHCAMHHLTA